ncbi:MAG: ribonuclease J, partial [Candidatus Binatia bacterium]
RDGVVVAILGIRAATGDVVSGPDLVSRGLVFQEASAALLEEARAAVVGALGEISPESRSDLPEVQETVRRALKRFFDRRLDRRPMILPFVLEM